MEGAVVTSPTSDLVAACRLLAEAGLSPGSSGNVSIRAGDRVFATPSGASLRRVLAEELSIVGMDGVPISGRPVTKELGMHLAVYAARPEVGAVVHLHSRAATAVSCLENADDEDPLPAYTPYRIRSLGRVALVPYAPPGSAELTAGVAAAVGSSAVMLLANHGSLVCAPDITTAVDLSEELEAAAELTLALRNLPARLIDPQRAWG
jgi:ribulose-5-phosphate 4-epimerase/fuculose-1-phosphate aldolase